jgi:ribokinase
MGQLAAENLDAEGVTHDLIESDSNLTGAVAVFVDQTGERSMVSGHGADFDLLPSEWPKGEICAPRHLHLTAWSFFTDPPRAAARAAADLAKSAGATLSFDPGSFQMIEEMGVDHFLSVTQDLGIDILLPNKEEGAVLTGVKDPEGIARELDRLYPSALVILKLDADGALVWHDGRAVHIPAATNRLVDATGAGDSFAGAFLARHLRGVPVVESARFATTISAWVIEHPGARPTPGPKLQAILARL